MTRSPPVLFVIAQPGAAAYFLPLWQRWSDDPTAPDWRLLIVPAARRHVAWPTHRADRLVDPATAEAAGFDAALAGWQPAVVVTSTSYHGLEREAVRWAKNAGSRTVQLIDAHYNYCRRIEASNVDGTRPDVVIVPDRFAAAEAAADGLPADGVRALGYPAWESVPVAATADPRRALFVSQPISDDHADSLGYTEQSALALALQAVEGEQALFDEILLALHPRENADRVPTHPRLRLVDTAQQGLAQAGTVLGMFSSFLVDAVLAGRRVVSLQPEAKGTDMCMLSRHGFISRAGSLHDLRHAMAAPPPDAGSLRQAYTGSLDRVDAFLRGAAA